jgi:Zn-dependent protease with chaperone function
MVALVPGWALAMFLFWLPLRVFVHINFFVFCLVYLAVGILLFFRPVQRLLLVRLVGARRPTRAERAIIDPVWARVCQSMHSSPRRYVLAVLDADDLNAFACGGHLVVVTSYAVRVLPDRELSGVLAHELCHHLGLHTVALTIRHWLGLPVTILARVGFSFNHIAQAATDAFGRGSTGLTIIGTLVAGVLRLAAWTFLVTILLSNALSNLVGRGAEFEADLRAVRLGYGPALASALRRFASTGHHELPDSWRARAFASHPPARTRIARIDAQLRQQQESRPRRPRDAGQPRPDQRRSDPR